MSSPSPHPMLLRLAHALLSKADRSLGHRSVTLKLDAKVLPELHATQTPDGLASIDALLQSLVQTGWVSLRTKKPEAFQTLADQDPTLALKDADALALWSGHQPAGPKWSRDLVQQLSAPGVLDVPDAPALLDYLQRNPLPWFQGLAAAECARTLNGLAQACRSGPSGYLRQLSARHFRGHSKVLDSREEMLRLLGAREGQFLEAPIQLLVSLPPGGGQTQAQAAAPSVLFIENLVSFEYMADARLLTWADATLVYASGFKGAARRLRTPQGSTLYWRHAATDAGRLAFADWLYAHDSVRQETTSVHFYGDLDWAGMQILAHLRQSFPNCEAWQPGYAGLLSLMAATGGHRPEIAAKEGQADPGFTGCAYADAVLLPALRQTGLCVDQEAWP
ncbi:MAG: Wadjet anti-phage system protein JetD domain-containing protein [Aquabacterium sp.]|uniref:Wadjet anti-phage system protein JetD domain-containing protein n=1 Tax=Aquabacterium sp. TaxID=1872578 RepID=UPI003BC842E1